MITRLKNENCYDMNNACVWEVQMVGNVWVLWYWSCCFVNVYVANLKSKVIREFEMEKGKMGSNTNEREVNL